MGESGFVIIDLKSSHEIILVCFKAPAVCFDAPNTTTPKILVSRVLSQNRFQVAFRFGRRNCWKLEPNVIFSFQQQLLPSLIYLSVITSLPTRTVTSSINEIRTQFTTRAENSFTSQLEAQLQHLNWFAQNLYLQCLHRNCSSEILSYFLAIRCVFIIVQSTAHQLMTNKQKINHGSHLQSSEWVQSGYLVI